MKRQLARKRGGAEVRGESVFATKGELDQEFGIGQVIGEEATPELACQVAETCREMLERLADEELKRITLAKMEGYSNEEIASQLGCVDRTIERKLTRIRKKWEMLETSSSGRGVHGQRARHWESGWHPHSRDARRGEGLLPSWQRSLSNVPHD